MLPKSAQRAPGGHQDKAGLHSEPETDTSVGYCKSACTDHKALPCRAQKELFLPPCLPLQHLAACLLACDAAWCSVIFHMLLFR